MLPLWWNLSIGSIKIVKNEDQDKKRGNLDGKVQDGYNWDKLARNFTKYWSITPYAHRISDSIKRNAVLGWHFRVKVKCNTIDR